MPVIFIGGMPRSGTTLMRAMLDAHPNIRCGKETRVIPSLLSMREKLIKDQIDKERLHEAGVTEEVLDSAMVSFILEIVAKHGEAAPYLCNKDPYTLKYIDYLSQLFPNAKFLFMIRDGRATCHSIISRHVTIKDLDMTSYRSCIEKWNTSADVMLSQCLRVGSHRCITVHYEQLILQPESWLRKIFKFLAIPWDDSVLHHEDFIEKPGGIALSRTEPSTNQIIKPVNLEALSKWVGKIPKDVVKDMASIAPMLKTLGYDPNANPPDYGKPDPRVANNTLHIQQNLEYWKQREDKILLKKFS
ncbi:hypothetical protein CHS0354_034451 [Potamilus streckersoni]|uniref:Protein-tyrosine sulfotransferase n=1 Tax=Potamilus streckersoni TaxID=2493646 RepID=A0AAE0VSA9_9BIVA|nr:hypothetical protein CHS0354_034451 [Potamilus streckersoni]